MFQRHWISAPKNAKGLSRNRSFHPPILLDPNLHVIWFTLPETNITPENKPSRKETSLPTIHFQVQAVSFREGSWWITPMGFCQTGIGWRVSSMAVLPAHCWRWWEIKLLGSTLSPWIFCLFKFKVIICGFCQGKSPRVIFCLFKARWLFTDSTMVNHHH